LRVTSVAGFGQDADMRHFDLVLIGTGSGNSIVDERFADWDIAIVEKGTFGGTCLNVGCIPTKMFVHTADVARSPQTGTKLGLDLELRDVRWQEIRDRIFGRIDPIAEAGRQYRIDNPNVTVYETTARFIAPKQLRLDTGEEISADRVVVAAGSRPILPDLPGLDRTPFHTSDTVMRLDTLPRRMVVLGSGYVGCELAHVFGSLGVDVTMVARGEQVLRAEDHDIAQRFTQLAAGTWDLRLWSKARHVGYDGTVIRLDLDGPTGPETVEAEQLLIAVGRTPNSDLLDTTAGGIDLHPDGRVRVDSYQRTSVEEVWALGDICSPFQLKHVANAEARTVQHNLANPEAMVESDHRFVPHAVFSDPQVASVGLTEQAAQALGVQYVTATHDYADIAYGWALENRTGFCKLLAEPTGGQLLGAHIIGPQASSLLQPLIQAMSFGLDVRRMAREQYWIHPALPELVENALLKLPVR
jgi:mycothione reductase